MQHQNGLLGRNFNTDTLIKQNITHTHTYIYTCVHTHTHIPSLQCSIVTNMILKIYKCPHNISKTVHLHMRIDSTMNSSHFLLFAIQNIVVLSITHIKICYDSLYCYICDSCLYM